MPRPSTSISPKTFKLTGPRNQHFKVWGSDMNAWPLLNVQLTTTGPYVWTVDRWVQNANHVHVFANPASTISPPPPTPAAPPVERQASDEPVAGARVKALGSTTGDLTITLTFDDPASGPVDIVEECNDIEYEP